MEKVLIEKSPEVSLEMGIFLTPFINTRRRMMLAIGTALMTAIRKLWDRVRMLSLARVFNSRCNWLAWVAIVFSYQVTPLESLGLAS